MYLNLLNRLLIPLKGANYLKTFLKSQNKASIQDVVSIQILKSLSDFSNYFAEKQKAKTEKER